MVAEVRQVTETTRQLAELFRVAAGRHDVGEVERSARALLLGFSLLLTVVSGVYGRCAVSRLLRWMVDDRAAAAGSLERVIGWAPERLIVAHGDPVEADVTPLLERELACAPLGEQLARG